jgi:hypothetical protein
VASISKRILSGSTAGRLIAVSATSSPGTTIHTAVAGFTDIDEVNLFAVNTSTSDVLLSIEYGSTGTAHEVDFVIPGQVGLVDVVTKLVLQDGAVIRAFAGTTNVLNIGGYVNRITASTPSVTESIYDAKGDIVVATADNTVSRLPIGANRFSLVADSAESTGVKWANAAQQELNSQSGTSYTFVLADAYSKTVQFTNGSAITATIPPNSSVAFPIGSVITLMQWGAGTVTVAPGSGVTLRGDGSKFKTNAQYAIATVMKMASDEWVMFGNVKA